MHGGGERARSKGCIRLRRPSEVAPENFSCCVFSVPGTHLPVAHVVTQNVLRRQKQSCNNKCAVHECAENMHTAKCLSTLAKHEQTSPWRRRRCPGVPSSISQQLVWLGSALPPRLLGRSSPSPPSRSPFPSHTLRRTSDTIHCACSKKCEASLPGAASNLLLSIQCAKKDRHEDGNRWCEVLHFGAIQRQRMGFCWCPSETMPFSKICSESGKTPVVSSSQRHRCCQCHRRLFCTTLKMSNCASEPSHKGCPERVA